MEKLSKIFKNSMAKQYNTVKLFPGC